MTCRAETRVTIGVALLLIVAGCNVAQPPPARLYVLTSLSPQQTSPSSPSINNLGILIGPVELPQYTNRPQIVTGDTGNELRRASQAQWAEPLQDNFTRILAENLSILLATDRIAVFPWTHSSPIDYQIIVEVTRFIGEPGGAVSLSAVWRVIGKEKKVLAIRKSTFNETTGSSDYGALAAAMSRAVAQLSRDIAAVVASL